MIQRLKMNKNLDKLKQFFRSNKSNHAHERVYILNSETEKDLRKDSSTEKRVKLLRDLGDIVLSNRLEEVSNYPIAINSYLKLFVFVCLVRNSKVMGSHK